MRAWLGSVAVLAFVMAATPGPNNLLFAAAGARQGYLRTVPMLAGMIGGFVVLIGAGVAGVGGLVSAVPGSQWGMRAAASAYLAYLGIRLWRATPPVEDARPGGHGPTSRTAPAPLMTWWQMTLFQLANPKTWLAVLTFVTGKLGPNSPGGLAGDLVGAAWFLVVVWLSASLWTLFGATLRGRLAPRPWRAAMRGMAVLAALSIATLW